MDGVPRHWSWVFCLLARLVARIKMLKIQDTTEKRTKEKKGEAQRILIQVGIFFFLVLILEEEEASLSGTW